MELHTRMCLVLMTTFILSRFLLYACVSIILKHLAKLYIPLFRHNICFRFRVFEKPSSAKRDREFSVPFLDKSAEPNFL